VQITEIVMTTINLTKEIIEYIDPAF